MIVKNTPQKKDIYIGTTGMSIQFGRFKEYPTTYYQCDNHDQPAKVL